MLVEIWSDVACPWCYVGKRRFERALELFEHRDAVTVRWRSFELDPGAPPERRVSGPEHLAAKYGIGLQQAHAANERLEAMAALEGLDLRLDSLRTGSTFDAHRLIHLGLERGVQDAVKERFMHGYFTENLLVSDHGTLRRLAGEAGLDEAEVTQVLASDRYAAEVRTDERAAAELGANGVPFFVIDRTFGVSGAQPSDLFTDVLERAWAQTRPLTVVGGDASCDGDACAI